MEITRCRQEYYKLQEWFMTHEEELDDTTFMLIENALSTMEELIYQYDNLSEEYYELRNNLW